MEYWKNGISIRTPFSRWKNSRDNPPFHRFIILPIRFAIGISASLRHRSIIPPFHHFNKNTLPIKITVEPINIKMAKTTAIICAFNEEKTIKNVVSNISDYLTDEIIVVNDGSLDSTKEILTNLQKEINFKYIELPENKGKGYAMAIGIEQAKGEIIVFIDADLSNLKEEHFFQLLSPILKNEADMVLGQATETLINYSVNPFKSLTGERALRKKEILPILDKIKHSRFGVETLINIYYQSQGKKIKYVMLNKLKHPTKFKKTTPINATKEFVIAGQEIAITVFNNYNLILKIIKKTIYKNIKI